MAEEVLLLLLALHVEFMGCKCCVAEFCVDFFISCMATIFFLVIAQLLVAANGEDEDVVDDDGEEVDAVFVGDFKSVFVILDEETLVLFVLIVFIIFVLCCCSFLIN